MELSDTVLKDTVIFLTVSSSPGLTYIFKVSLYYIFWHHYTFANLLDTVLKLSFSSSVVNYCVIYLKKKKRFTLWSHMAMFLKKSIKIEKSAILCSHRGKL